MADKAHQAAAVGVPAFTLPFSPFASAEAAATFAAQREAAAPPGSDIAALRAHYGAFNGRLLAGMLALFDVDIREDVIAGVPVHRVRRRDGPVEEGRLVVNLHGGGFMWGSGSGALVEAVPLAAAGGMEVVAVDYRLAPEHLFPAASEDLEAVYAELLKTHPASAIGFYGCSAGAALACQSIARLAVRGETGPGALALIGAAGLETPGDSAWTAAAMGGEARGPDGVLPPPIDLAQIPYLAAAAAGGDPTVLPGNAPELLKAFPPSLLITATRDFAASSMSVFHRRLAGQGVDARFFCFDGLWHTFHVFGALPESREVYGLLAAHFDRHLSR